MVELKKKARNRTLKEMLLLKFRVLELRKLREESWSEALRMCENRTCFEPFFRVHA